MSEKPVRIGLVHALEASIAPIEDAFSRFWPEAEAVNLLDGSLYLDYDAAGEVTSSITRRIQALIHHAVGFGARGLLLTGSLFSQAVQDARKDLPVPALAAYEAMIEEAFACGSRFGLIATYAGTITMMEADIERYARQKRDRLPARIQDGRGCARGRTVGRQGAARLAGRGCRRRPRL